MPPFPFAQKTSNPQATDNSSVACICNLVTNLNEKAECGKEAYEVFDSHIKFKIDIGS
jgi:hypothetical protein